MPDHTARENGQGLSAQSLKNMISENSKKQVTERLFENKSLIKNKKSFWVSPFFKTAASSEAFWKKLHQKLL
ncbi:hypothetical protein [Komagataeibacter medellinensis]|uniref:hypothetical protein n=1 Tax=Komagataeibacter medellinensis TaxID=1177712 RepID=UPI00129679CE|nr:hypothetical protein [Komagataeibacter medellinensis]